MIRRRAPDESRALIVRIVLTGGRRSLAPEVAGAVGSTVVLAVDEQVEPVVAYEGVHIGCQENVAGFDVAVHVFLFVDVR